MNKIEKFIKDNNLDFTGSGSDLNGQCVILAGYACYLEIPDIESLIKELDDFDPKSLLFTIEANGELNRVFKYALNNNYGDYWKTETAKETYKF